MLIESNHWNLSDTLPKAFFQTARRVYAHEPFWLAEDPANIQRLFSRHSHHPGVKAWLGLSADAARLVGFMPPKQGMHADTIAYFGFWESINHLEINQQLFHELELWAKAHGATQLIGPINFSTHQQYRIRTSAQQGHPPFMGEPFNPDYYAAILEQCHFSQCERYVSHEFPTPERMQPFVNKNASRLEKFAARQITLQPLTPDFWLQHITHFHQAVEGIFAQNFAYSAIDRQDFLAQYGENMAKLLCPHTSLVALKGDEIAGFVLCFPDYAPLLFNNPTSSIESFTLDYPRLAQPKLLVKTLGILPEYRNTWLANAFTVEVIKRSTPYYHSKMSCLMRVGNHCSKLCSSISTHTRRYGLYSKKIAT